MSRPVIIAAGGTGGHVIPALAVAAQLQQRDVPVIWLGTRSGLEARLVPAHDINIHWISVAGLRGKSILQTVVAPFKLMRSCFQSLLLVRRLKPSAVLGMGGFVSGPVGIAALVLRKPLVLHEQNAVAGMTNRWLSGKASRIFAAWPGAFGKASANEKVVGNPVNAQIAQLAADRHYVEFDRQQPLRILVVGGSRGARVLNEIVPAAIAQLPMPVKVHHQTGTADCDVVRTRYKSASLAASTVTDFINDMVVAYQSADLIICRSGAMTVTEISALGVPGILVPFPYAVDDHQTRNADQLSQAGAAIVMAQSVFTAESLSHEISLLALDRARLSRMSLAAQSCFVPKAAEVVADALIEVAR